MKSIFAGILMMSLSSIASAQVVGSTYNLVAKHSGKCIDIQQGSPSNGAAAIQWDCNSAYANQKFQLRSAGTGLYQLVATHSGKCLDVYQAISTNGGTLVQWDCANVAN